MKTLRYLLGTAFRSYTANTLMLLFSIVVAVFGLNVVLGYAESTYRGFASGIDYTLLTVAGMDEKAKQTDMMALLEPCGASAALYFCRTQDGAVLIGFDGSDKPGNWWSHMGGEFVNDYAGADDPAVIYLNSYEAEVFAIGSSYELDGVCCRVIGFGWIEPGMLSRLIRRSSPQTVFDLSGSAGGDVDTEDSSRRIRVIPYRLFKERYEPELILIHLPSLTYTGMQKAAARLSEMLPGSTVTPPAKDAFENFWYALRNMGRFLPLFLLLTEITLTLSVCELYKKLRPQGRILRIYGMSRRRLRLYLIAEFGVLYGLGTLLAVLLQAALKKPLSLLSISVLPTLPEIAAAVLVSFAIALLFSLPELIRGLRLLRSGEE